MPAYYLEFAVVVLGLVLLLAEAFTGQQYKRLIAYGALGGLALVFLGLFGVTPNTGGDEALWAFYTDDKPALFYKGLSLVCTAVVIILSMEYLPVLMLVVVLLVVGFMPNTLLKAVNPVVEAILAR